MADRKAGYIDRSGSLVIKPKFEKTYDFAQDGWAAVEIKNAGNSLNHTAFIDRSGAIVLQTDFETVSSFSKSDFAQVIAWRPMGQPIRSPASQCAAAPTP
ncbi:MAG: WG repeat-containing protein [Caulobacteraceae bacterium]